MFKDLRFVDEEDLIDLKPIKMQKILFAFKQVCIQVSYIVLFIINVSKLCFGLIVPEFDVGWKQFFQGKSKKNMKKVLMCGRIYLKVYVLIFFLFVLY